VKVSDGSEVSVHPAAAAAATSEAAATAPPPTTHAAFAAVDGVSPVAPPWARYAWYSASDRQARRKGSAVLPPLPGIGSPVGVSRHSVIMCGYAGSRQIGYDSYVSPPPVLGIVSGLCTHPFADIRAQ